MTAIENYVFGFSSLLGFLLTIYVMVKVQSVSKMQRRERELLKQLYGLEDLLSTLGAASNHLRSSTAPGCRELLDKISQTIGKIKGINQALGVSENRVKLSEGDYFTTTFLIQRASNTDRNLDILCYRNMQVAEIDVIQAFQRAASRGVSVRILSLSSHSPERILTEIINFLPHPPAQDAQILRDQLAKNEQKIVSAIRGVWHPQCTERFLYRGYTITPRIHFLRSDDTLFLGFLGMFSHVQPAYLDQRPYIEISIFSGLGQQLMNHFNALWETSARNELKLS